ncbi:uncharacterized protein DUF4123 [Paucimonas lemoignei]|uniref:Uncharacterized protein DUF4123 n=1 Tax=Paucimonas lemoignei TaxID=29443 RepID=A0A4R3HUE7_PAULE|nr:DUF4123 domain-containing protein [Paucimonas lemoignei]TCS33313.1 uncharacterized protein DUF4123 [Paucimonas lemoignei]
MESLYPVRLLADHQYALLDRVANAGIPEDWPLVPLAPQGFENEEHLLPALIPLQEMSAAQQEDLLEMLDRAQDSGDVPVVVTFLASDVDLERMRLHWTRQLMIYLPGGGRALLRSYDPRVFMQLRWMFTPAQLGRLFGPIDKWTVYNGQSWQSHARPDGTHSTASPIDTGQAIQLGRIGQINQVLAQFSATHLPELESVSRKIHSLLVRAQEHGLMAEQELIAFAMHGMTVHPNFYRHPDIARRIAEIDRSEQTYLDAIASIDAAHWQRIAQGLGKTSSAAAHLTGPTP